MKEKKKNGETKVEKDGKVFAVFLLCVLRDTCA